MTKEKIDGRRIAAFILDYFIFAVLTCVLLISTLIAPIVLGMDITVDSAKLRAFLSIAAAVTLYMLKDSFPGGSIGKKAMHCRVISLKTGTDASFLQKLVRNLFLPFYLIEFIAFLANGRRLGDMAAGTQVACADTQSAAAAKAPSGKSRLPSVIIAGTVGALALFVGFMLISTTAGFRESEPYQYSRNIITNSTLISSYIGPFHDAVSFSGSVAGSTCDSGGASFSYTIKGKNGRVRVFIQGTKEDGLWSYDTFLFYPNAADRSQYLDMLRPSSVYSVKVSRPTQENIPPDTPCYLTVQPLTDDAYLADAAIFSANGFRLPDRPYLPEDGVRVMATEDTYLYLMPGTYTITCSSPQEDAEAAGTGYIPCVYTVTVSQDNFTSLTLGMARENSGMMQWQLSASDKEQM